MQKTKMLEFKKLNTFSRISTLIFVLGVGLFLVSFVPNYNVIRPISYVLIFIFLVILILDKYIQKIAKTLPK